MAQLAGAEEYTHSIFLECCYDSNRLIMRLKFWGFWFMKKYLFITITLRSTLTPSGSRVNPISSLLYSSHTSHHPSQTPCIPLISYATQKLILDSCKIVQKQSEAFHTFLWHFSKFST